MLSSLELFSGIADGLLLLAQDDAPGQKSIAEQFFSSPLPLIGGFMLIWYITYLAPERKRRAEEANLLSSLTKNDRVVTVGGLHGTVVSANPDSDTIMLKIDESGNTRVKINRSAVVSVNAHAKGKSLPGNESSGGDSSD